MDGFIRIPLGDRVADGIQWIVDNLGGLFDVIRAIFVGMYDALFFVFSEPSFWVVALVAAAIGLLARGWVFGIGTGVGLLLIASMDQWQNAMSSLALIIVATVWALVISIPLGIAAAKSDLVSKIVRPVLDFLQTMPAFVYLIPALLLFRVGVAPGIFATIIFAMAPGVRLTELGIRGVDREVVEAGHAFGSPGGRILRQIQLPLALPTIMAGVNQVIMLALSMVVIAGMVGAGGLGGDVVASLNRLDTALGVEAGLSVVVLAIILDRLTGSFGKRAGLFAKLQSAGAGRRTARPEPAEEQEVETASPRRAPVTAGR
ncbi:ABC transporter permease subunit [Microbacterium betulae]|uniref:ABC transporter permease subunit n=1 Tax=Microbacterium betulae TaxID=2981139 RepID=A0AA97FKM7_9MICO|nr:ABC transporter permease subunit [Microbacterium sp. AB]WOF24559.1 ABC transporter permease subunit [Microbacterium sp. AB]